MYISWPEPTSWSSVKSLKKKKKRHWDTLVPISDRTWRSLTMSIMEVYASRTHGSYIEETEMKVLWQYRDADLEFGYLQARELEDHLSNVLRQYPVDILHGGVEEGGYVEVRPKGVNKGVFAMKAICYYDKLKGGNGAGQIDFGLVLGDDHCDEPMLSVMRQIGQRVRNSQYSGATGGGNGGSSTQSKNDHQLPMTMRLVDVSVCDPNISNDAEIFTCTVGKKPSAASNYLQDVSEVEELLQALVKVSKNPNASKSMLDLMIESQQNISELEDTSNTSGAFGEHQRQPRVRQTSLRSDFVANSLGEFFSGMDNPEEDDDMFF